VRGIARIKRHSALLAAASYLVVGLVVLAPSIRPGHTLVPADILSAVQPYDQIAHGVHDHNPIVSDAAFQFFPWVHAFGVSLQHGHLPQWNPAILGGLPTSPNGFIPPYYPPSWLAALLNPFDFYNVFVLLHLVLGALGIYAFARVVGARRLSSWLVGLLAFTAAFWVHWSLHLGHFVGLVWAPWALAATHLLLTKPRPRNVAALGVVFGLWWLGGNPQYVYYGSLALAGYAAGFLLLRAASRRDALLLPSVALAGGLLLGVALAAPVFLTSLTVTNHIARGREPPASTEQTHLYRTDAIRVLVNEARGNPPDHVKESTDVERLMDAPFIGVSAVVLIGAALFARDRRVLLLAGAVLVVVILAFTGSVHAVLYHLPGYDRFRVSARWIGLLPVFALPLAALGIDALRAGDRRARIGLAATAVLCAALTIGWYLHQRDVRGAPHIYLSHRVALTLLVLAAVTAAGLMVRRRMALGIAVLAVCILGEVLFHTPRWYPQIAERSAYPAVAATKIARERGGRIVHVGTGTPSPLMPVAPDIAMAYGIADVQGWTVLFPTRYDRYLRVIDDYGRFAYDANAAPAFPPASVGSPLLDALGVRTVVSDTALDAPGLQLLSGDNGTYVYARQASGDAVLVPAADGVDEGEMWRRVGDPAWRPQETAAVVGLKTPIRGTSGSVTRRSRSSDTDSWTVDAPQGGFLRVSANYDDGWHATIDGRPAPVLLADGIFRGVVVPPGRHTVRFHYASADARRGLWISGAAILALVVLVAIGRRQKSLR
jgi:hypothetical protein